MSAIKTITISKNNEPSATRIIAAGSLILSAVCLLTGRRRAALGAAGLGATIALMENPESIRDFWGRIPAYLATGQQLIERAETVLEDITEKSSRVQKILRRS